jgi:hypothetical protein
MVRLVSLSLVLLTLVRMALDLVSFELNDDAVNVAHNEILDIPDSLFRKDNNNMASEEELKQTQATTRTVYQQPVPMKVPTVDVDRSDTALPITMPTRTSAVEFTVPHIPMSIAPWDPIVAPGGAERLSEPCADEIKALCRNSLPVKTCLDKHMEELGKECLDTLRPCRSSSSSTKTQSPEQDLACRTSTSFRPHLPASNARAMEEILLKVDQAAASVNAVYWMTAGSAIGALLHHGRIPWDDDIDIYVPRENFKTFLRVLEKSSSLTSYESAPGLVWKVFERNATKIPKKKWGWPNIDVFPVDCNATVCVEQPLMSRTEEIVMDTDMIFPLKRRPFGRISPPFPSNLRGLVEKRYGQRFGDKCVRGGYDHSKERFHKKWKLESNCSDVHFYPSFATKAETPWCWSNVTDCPPALLWTERPSGFLVSLNDRRWSNDRIVPVGTIRDTPTFLVNH